MCLHEHVPPALLSRALMMSSTVIIIRTAIARKSLKFSCHSSGYGYMEDDDDTDDSLILPVSSVLQVY